MSGRLFIIITSRLFHKNFGIEFKSAKSLSLKVERQKWVLLIRCLAFCSVPIAVVK